MLPTTGIGSNVKLFTFVQVQEQIRHSGTGALTKKSTMKSAEASKQPKLETLNIGKSLVDIEPSGSHEDEVKDQPDSDFVTVLTKKDFRSFEKW